MTKSNYTSFSVVSWPYFSHLGLANLKVLTSYIETPFWTEGLQRIVKAMTCMHAVFFPTKQFVINEYFPLPQQHDFWSGHALSIISATK